ncbi:MAG: hypothetical protein WCF67_14275 [Chitinophagaceae bacterium]
MKNNLNYLIFFLFVLTSCTNAGNTENTQRPKSNDWINTKDIPADICYVLCDFSASQGNKSRQTIRQNAISIYQSAATKCKIRFYDINAPQLEGPFFEFPDLLKNVQKPSQRKIMKAKAHAQKDTLDLLISNRMNTISKSTCIIKALDMVAASLKKQAAQYKDQRISVVILSDMLEDCNFDFGRINIDKGNFREADRVLATMPNPPYTFKGYKNLSLAFAASSTRTDINMTSLNNFWKQVLKKYEYDSPDPITPELPAWAETNH